VDRRILLAAAAVAVVLALVPALSEGSGAYANSYAYDFEVGEDVDVDLTSLVGQKVLFLYSGSLPDGLSIRIEGQWADTRTFLRGTVSGAPGAYVAVISDDSYFYELSVLVTSGECVVTYDAGIGLVNGERTWSETLQKGSYASLPRAAHSSGAYSFLGWAEKAGSSKPLDSFLASKDCTLHAVWKRNTVLVSDASATVSSGQRAEVPLGTSPWDASISVDSSGSLPSSAVSIEDHMMVLDMTGVKPGTYYVEVSAGCTGYISGKAVVTVNVPITIVRPVELVLQSGDTLSFTPVTEPSSADIALVEVSRDGSVLGAHGGLSVSGRTVTGALHEPGTYAITYVASLEGYVETSSTMMVRVLERAEPTADMPAPSIGDVSVSPRAGDPRVYDLVASGLANVASMEWLADGVLVASSSPTAVCEFAASGIHTITFRATGLDGSTVERSVDAVCRDNYHREAAWSGVPYGYVVADGSDVSVQDGSPFSVRIAKVDGRAYSTVTGTPSSEDVGKQYRVSAGTDSWTVRVYEAQAFAPAATFSLEVGEDGRTVTAVFRGEHASFFSYDFDGDGIPEPGDAFTYPSAGLKSVVCTAVNNVSETSFTASVTLQSDDGEAVPVLDLTDFRMELGERMEVLVSSDPSDRVSVSGSAASFVKVDGGLLSVDPSAKGEYDLTVTVLHSSGQSEQKTIHISVEGSQVHELEEDRHDFVVLVAAFFAIAVIAVAFIVLGGRRRRL